MNGRPNVQPFLWKMFNWIFVFRQCRMRRELERFEACALIFIRLPTLSDVGWEKGKRVPRRAAHSALVQRVRLNALRKWQQKYHPDAVLAERVYFDT